MSDYDRGLAFEKRDVKSDGAPRRWWEDRYGWKGWVIIATAVLAIVVVLAVVIPTARWTSRMYSQRECTAWSRETDRETKFVDYTFWSWDCLTPNPSQPGEWIPTGQLRGI